MLRENKENMMKAGTRYLKGRGHYEGPRGLTKQDRTYKERVVKLIPKI